MVVLILAAGYATRLYPYTLNMPKPLLQIDGKPLIDFIVEKALVLPELNKLIVVTNNKYCGKFEEWRKSRKNPLIKILNDGTNSVETRLGAIGDIGFAIDSEKIDDDLTVIAGDNLFTYSLLDMHSYFTKIDRDCICVKPLDNPDALKSLGVCELDDRSKVVSFVEKPEHPRSNLAVFATYMLKKESLRFIYDFLDTADKKDAPGYFIEWLYKQTDVYGYIMDGECYDIGTVEAYESIRRNFPPM